MPADHRRLVQVLDNLIANAVKFSHRNQRVPVTAGLRVDQLIATATALIGPGRQPYPDTPGHDTLPT